jgi:hypothetical protein
MAKRSRYWRQLRRLAWRQTLATLFESNEKVVIEIILFVTYCGLAYFLLGEGQVAEDLPSTLLVGAAPLLVFPVVWVVRLSQLPPTLASRQQRRVRRLAGRLVGLRAVANSPLTLSLMQELEADLSEEDMALWHRLQITNRTAQKVDGCQLLVKVEGGIGWPPLPRGQFYISEPFTVRNGEPQAKRLVRFSHLDPSRPAEIQAFVPRGNSWIQPDPLRLRPGHYRLEIFLVCDSAAHRSLNIEIRWDDVSRKWFAETAATFEQTVTAERG